MSGTRSTPGELAEIVRSELVPQYHVTPGGLKWSRSTDALRKLTAQLVDREECLDAIERALFGDIYGASFEDLLLKIEELRHA